MIDQLTAYLLSFGDWLYGWFIAPGSYLLNLFADVAPAAALGLGISAAQTEVTLVFALSLFCWITLCIVLGTAWELLRSWSRQLSALIRSAWHGLLIVAASRRTLLVLKIRSLLPRWPAAAATIAPSVEFDDLDLAVLHSVSDEGPGFTLSAPELAERMSLLPARIQQSLDKLSRNNMLQSAIGSTDGFDNYRLSETGAAFVSMWQRRESRG